MLSPKCRHKRLQCYDWWKKLWNNKITYENKIATTQGDDYTSGCLLYYTYFKNHYKMIPLDLSKQQALDTDPKAYQQINFTADLNRARNTRIYFILEEEKEKVL